MSNQDEDLLHGTDEDQPSSAWWSPSSPLTPEVTSSAAPQPARRRLDLTCPAFPPDGG
jgi:hypothetical protein